MGSRPKNKQMLEKMDIREMGSESKL